MSCDNWTFCSAIIDPAAYSSPAAELDDHAAAREPDVERDPPPKRFRSGLAAVLSKSKAQRDETRARIIADTTHVCPQYVWGDEGPIND
jgi:hypothetical protein